MPDLDKMTDQELIDYFKQRGQKNKTIKKIANQKNSENLLSHFEDENIIVRCPNCNSLNYIKHGQNSSGYTRFKCKDCNKTFSVSNNTIFDGTAFTWDEMVNAVYCVITKMSIKNSGRFISNKQIQDGTMWALYHKILRTIADINWQPKLSGVIQIDEKYFREDQKGSHNLISFLEDGSKRYKRRHNYASKCGIFGPEFTNVLCAVDNKGHYFSKCICLGPMSADMLSCLDDVITDVSYICTDNYTEYDIWVKEKNYIHYVEPSNYRKERKARGYIDTDNPYVKLTDKEYAIDKAINKQMYIEKRYPHLENTDNDIDYEQFIALKYKFNLNINAVNSFHSELERYLVSQTSGVSSIYLKDYIGTFTFLKNYKTSFNIKNFSMEDAKKILAMMIKDTLAKKSSPTDADIKNTTLNLKRPTPGKIKKAKSNIKKARVVIKVEQRNGDRNEYEGDDEQLDYIFDKYKFFRSIGTIRLNELIKTYGLYQKGSTKAQKIEKMCKLPDAQDIIFREIYLQKYGSLNELKDAIENCEPPKVSKKRGRPKGSKNKKKQDD